MNYGEKKEKTSHCGCIYYAYPILLSPLSLSGKY